MDRGFVFEAEPRSADRIVLMAEESGDDIGYTLRRRGSTVEAVPDPPAGGPRPSWARYADGVIDRALADFGDAPRGAEVTFRSDLPVAAGLSSSSALVTGLFLALDAVCRFSDRPAFRTAVPHREALATWLSAAEMGGPVGTRGGSEDHTAILCAEAGRVIRYGLAPVRYRGSAPVPDGWTFAVGVSGVVADKGGGVQAHYNRLSDLARDAARAWAAGTAKEPNLGHALEAEVDPDDVLDAIRGGAPSLGLDPEPLVRRARHFLEECGLVDSAFKALQAGDVEGFAAAANRSAAVGAELLENQVPETLALADIARELGAAAASPFGGGFGGSVWALVRAMEADDLLVAWRERYLERFPARAGAGFFTTPASPAASGHDPWARRQGR